MDGTLDTLGRCDEYLRRDLLRGSTQLGQYLGCSGVRSLALVQRDSLVNRVANQWMDKRERWFGIQEIDAGERGRCRCHLAPVEIRKDRGALPIRSIAEHRHCSRELRRLLWKPS